MMTATRRTPQRMSRAELRRLGESMGVTVEETRTNHWFEATVEAPQGKVWSANWSHELISQSCTGDADWYAAARADLADLMRYGVEDCSNAECEWCHSDDGGGSHAN